MAKKKLPNPFYLIVVLVGVAFTVTACAYGMSTFIYMQIDNPRVPHPDSVGWVEYVDQNGLTYMLVELVILGIATVGVLAWDSIFEDPKAETETAPSSSAQKEEEPPEAQEASE